MKHGQKREDRQSQDFMAKKRLAIIFALFCIALVGLCVRTGYQQLVMGPEYAKKAAAQQTKDEVLQPERGKIYDRNGEELAVSVITYSVWLRPAMITDEDDKKLVKESLIKILNINGTKIDKYLSSETNLLKIAKYQKSDVAQQIREAGLVGVSLTQETKRNYPLGDFASQLLGSVTDDNNGLSGLEMYYNKRLKGSSGRSIEVKDASGKSLTYGNSTQYSPEDGDSLELTIDAVIQNYAEQAVKDCRDDTGAERVSCLMMNPKTGEVLAMASTPGFDPNDAHSPRDEDKKKYNKMTSEEQLEYLNVMWRNFLVNDTYEPGSTFKLLTTAMALEENVVNDKEKFDCDGGVKVEDTFLKCWCNPKSHGTQTLKQAVGNSCNPVFVELALRLGKSKFYDYLDLFGITDRTGIDYPGEAAAQIQYESNIASVELSTMAYGQGIAVTAVQLLTTINSFLNDGYMVQPHLVKRIVDASGNVKEEIKGETIRQTVSKKTSKKIKEYMEYVVQKGGGKRAKVSGYRVGGKTGTAQKINPDTGKYEKLMASFAGAAPINDPEVSILFIVDEPEGEVWGSDVAAPYAKEILQKTFLYLNIDKAD